MARRFPREFRVRAIELVRISDRPLSQVALELGVPNSAVDEYAPVQSGTALEKPLRPHLRKKD